MLLHATHTADGHELSPEERDAAGAPFLGWIEVPGAPETDIGESTLCRVRGWVVARPGRSASVVATVGDRRQLLAITEDRPDVLEQHAAEFAMNDARCGFDDLLDLRGAGGSPASVAVEIGDGSFAARVVFTVHHPDHPPAPPRGDYKSVWNAVAGDVETAKLAVSGFTDESEYRRLAQLTVDTLDSTVGLRPDDVVLEIGAGVGRVGPVISPLVKRWIATDVSENMLRHIEERTSGLANVETVALSGWDLAPIASESIDVVYSTVVFMHLDEWERFSYVREAMRVLRPSGRVYVDNFNLLSGPGWDFFMENLEAYHPLERPPNISKSSTPSELRTFLERAGFEDVRVLDQPDHMWVLAHGVKRADAAASPVTPSGAGTRTSPRRRASRRGRRSRR